MKLIALLIATSLTGAGAWLWHRTPTAPAAIELQEPLPAQTPLVPTPRSRFTPTPSTRKGYYNIDVVGDFTVPSTKKIIFNGAGRNLHVGQDRTKLFRRGFTAVDRTRMVPDVENLAR